MDGEGKGVRRAPWRAFKGEPQKSLETCRGGSSRGLEAVEGMLRPKTRGFRGDGYADFYEDLKGMGVEGTRT